MKRSILILTALISYSIIFSTSCKEKEPTVNIKGIETQIYNNIYSYREANGVTGAFVHQPVMVKEAQLFSTELISSSSAELDTAGIGFHWDIIHAKLGGYNDALLLQITSDTEAADIFANWTDDADNIDLLLGEYTQCGVGVEYGGDNGEIAYVTVMMMFIPSI